MVAIYLAHAWYFAHYVNDDAFITFRYSRFVTLGRGPFYNVGEPVEGYSNFLLLLLLIPVIALGGADAALPAARVIGAASGVLSLALACTLALSLQARETPPWRAASAGWLAAGLIAVSPAYALNSMSGLETALFGACLAAGVVLGTWTSQHDRWYGAGAAFAAAAWARPEGALLFAVYWCAQAASAVATGSLRRLRTPLLLDAAVVSAAVGAQLAFRYAVYDGAWLPNTYYAKSGGFWAIDAWSYIRDGMVTPLGGILGIGLAAIAWVSARDSHRWVAPVAAVALTGAALPFVTGTDWMPGERLLMPFLPLAAALTGVGWMRAAGRLPAPRWLAPAIAAAGIALLGAGQHDRRAALFDETSMRARGYHEGHRALGEWLRSGAAAPGDTVALMDIGIVGYEAIDQRILDITGLTDRFIARSPGEFLAKRYDPAYVFDQQPRFIVLVLKQPGDPAGRPEGTGYSTWTDMEHELLSHPEFARWYRQPRAPLQGEPAWPELLARGFGAVRVFQHAHPGTFYLLTVFERQPVPAG